MELGSPQAPAQEGARLPFVESFVETLVVMRHGGDQTAFARHLATVQYAFVSLDELRALLESMHQDEMANEEGCRSAQASSSSTGDTIQSGVLIATLSCARSQATRCSIG